MTEQNNHDVDETVPDEVEGHRMRHLDATDDDDDVEGHRMRHLDGPGSDSQVQPRNDAG